MRKPFSFEVAEGWLHSLLAQIGIKPEKDGFVLKAAPGFVRLVALS